MVKNMEESMNFYNKLLGLPIDRRFKAGPKTDICFLGGKKDTKVELICTEGEDVSFGKDISLGFEVKSLDQMMKMMKENGIEIHSGPMQPNPHVKYFFVLDPNGLKIQFVENVKQ